MFKVNLFNYKRLTDLLTSLDLIYKYLGDKKKYFFFSHNHATIFYIYIP